eukprot:TRINITY_DN10078_c0_g1_i1.p1 TRINITY_DN10078_c0_g1~~TRINITY_DN10078_c0_g1_i1.p1  ORF type:complete len:105 (-),score=14.22 TRINITY_DN10078_c0_g1_i1:6-320(-)
MKGRPPRSTLSSSSAASDVYKRQGQKSRSGGGKPRPLFEGGQTPMHRRLPKRGFRNRNRDDLQVVNLDRLPVSYTHLRAHETVLDLVCRLLLEKKKTREQHTMK